ncbi:DNA polymerase Y family protein [Frankia sp. R82]|uniref:DNA polymerase Y family protein n=1 Tax=Frankia sp. R82 TaxID=2950553 RepID=UPI002044943E|nr:DNA polymerase Y family protein [Frankia sp. R82]MCM3886431.1 DNA polymerase Y family protein [Frankia sp. R82]
MPVRMLAVHYPAWSVIAAGFAADLPAAVLVAGRVVAATPAAAQLGVRSGLRRREAQARCPEITLVADDPGRAARVFEPVLGAVESVIPGVEVRAAGTCVVPIRGAARYFGGEDAAVAEVRRALTGAWPAIVRQAGRGPETATDVEVGVGVADGPFAAQLAARVDAIVPVGDTPALLAPLPVGLLADAELVDLLRRLGLETLGAFAALPAAAVAERFGPAGSWAHTLARGADPRAVTPREQPVDLGVATAFDPPADRVEQAAFAARRLAEAVHELLRTAGLACTGIRIEATTDRGERHTRIWRHDGPLSAAATTDRVRWQLDGWLTSTATVPAQLPGVPPSPEQRGVAAGLVHLRIEPVGLVPAEGRQLGLWGEPGAAAARAGRAFARVQGLLGPQAVLTAVVEGGRDPVDRIRLVPWGEPRVAGGLDRPWPGRLPAPAPTLVHCPALAAEVLDEAGEPVRVSGRCTVTAPPARLAIGAEQAQAVTGWAGPWPLDERWWEPDARRRARFQLRVADGGAYLLALMGGRWWVEASYD